MAENNHKDNELLRRQPLEKPSGSETDLSFKFLSDAFRLSFFLLKIIMVLLVVIYLFSGFRTVESYEKGIVLRFGKIIPVGRDRLLGPGPHWVLPYPIYEVVKVPVGQKPNISLNTFWYYMTEQEQANPDAMRKRGPKPELDPLRDGYCLTRSEKQGINIGDTEGSDYNIIHSKWQLTYQITNAERFYTNVYVNTENLAAGQSYADAITDNIKPLLESMIADAVVTAMVEYTIEEAMFEKVAQVTEHVKKLLQQNLDRIESGITVVSVQLDDITWPRQVDNAFLASIQARQWSDQLVSDARTYAQNTLNEAGGPVARELLEAIHDETATQEQKELLWSQLAGEGQEKIYLARGYRTKVVKTAQANADYLQAILPEYRKRPELVVQNIYLDAVESILEQADEKIIVQPTQGTKGREIRININRDPSLKPREAQKQAD